MRRTIITLCIVIGFQALGFAQTDPETLKAQRRVYAPQVVGVPPENACRGLMVLPDGEIRHYGFRHDAGNKSDAYQPIYEASSADGGESWTAPAPSRCYATITLPRLFRMSALPTKRRRDRLVSRLTRPTPRTRLVL